jgi:hypothetical protein
LASFRVETLSDFALTNQMFVVSAIHEGLSFRIIAVRYPRYPRPEQLFVNPSIVVGLTVRVGETFRWSELPGHCLPPQDLQGRMRDGDLLYFQYNVSKERLQHGRSTDAGLPGGQSGGDPESPGR